jgi:phage terminase Nu1 subunit (DNA packaging protein)
MTSTEQADIILADINTLAQALGKSRRTLFRWKRGGMPVLPDGRFNLAEVRRWVDRRQGIPPADHPGEEVPAQDGKDWWDKETKKYQARLRELDYRKRKGELVERKRVDDLFTARVTAVKQGLLALERALPPELATCKTEREMSVVIRAKVRALLEAFARPLPKEIRLAEEDQGS